MISIKSPQEINIMRQGGRILAEIMRRLEQEVRPGIATKALDKLAQELIFKYKAEPAFLGYDGFPAALCTSVNEVIVHGIPCDYELRPGDILSLDLGVKYKGYYSDMAVTVPVGKIDLETARLIRVAKKTIKRAIKKTKPGNTFGDIGETIYRYATKRGFSVIEELCGHGIGQELHEGPEVLNRGKRGAGAELKQGMVFCPEPMLSLGSMKIKRAEDGYAFKTEDNSLSVHFEHTVAVTKTGNCILTTI
jgi:methionyl aminopeptidase